MVPGSCKERLLQLLSDFFDLFGNNPGRTTLVEHTIEVRDVVPIRQRPYRVHYAQNEVEKMLQVDVIRPSTSQWAFPIILVEKKDGSVRFSVDFRKLNAVAKFDAYPMPRIDEVLEHKPGTAAVISTIDLSKGYWQIPLSPNTKEKTAFTTPCGLWRCCSG